MSQSLINKSRLLEKYVQVVREDGLNTNKNVNVGINGSSANLWVAGNVSIGGSLAVTGPITETTNIATLSAATAAPSAAQSGTTFLLNRAGGITVTLPAPTVGLRYTFVVITSVTATAYKVITDVGTTLLQGVVVGATTTASAFESVVGSANISVTMNGSTTGGLVGTQISFTCISSTLWQVTGTNFGSGSPATPFANT